MSVSIIWDEHNNMIIGDVHWKWHERLRNYMLEHYFRPHHLYEALDLQNEPGIEDEYRNYVTHFLRNECSIVVMDEKTNEIHAVALLKWMTKEWRSWTQLRLVVDSPKLNEWITMRRKMMFEYAKEHPKEPFDSLHLFEFCIAPPLNEDEEFIMKFFNAICETARHMGMPRLTFLAISMHEQMLAENVELVELNRFIYSMYIEKGRRPFGVMRGIGELNAILYGKDLEPIIPFYEMNGFDDKPKKEKEDEPLIIRMPSAHSRSHHSVHSEARRM